MLALTKTITDCNNNILIVGAHQIGLHAVLILQPHSLRSSIMRTFWWKTLNVDGV